MVQKISSLLASSREVIQSCCLKNGAIVAADTDNPSYPKDVNNYRYVWPRDAAYTIYAAKIMGLDIQEHFVRWLLERAEDFSDNGLIYQRYATNGARDTEFGFQWQPDQAASLLWSFLSSGDEKVAAGSGASSDSVQSDDTRHTIALLADGICNNWDKDHFTQYSYDLWEERCADPRYRENFTYSLAACSKGLIMAYGHITTDGHIKKKDSRGQAKIDTKIAGNVLRWKAVSEEMAGCIAKIPIDHFPRSWGKLPDKRIDASVMALVWPFDVAGVQISDRRLERSLALLGQHLITEKGVMRYKDDEYDGMIKDLKHQRKGAGGWPLLMFWYIIIQKRLGKAKEARELFTMYLRNFDTHIPEQVFDNHVQHSVTPLCWSHAMFVICARELGYI